MKLDVINNDEIIIYLNKCYVKDINFKDKDALEEYFRCLFLNLKTNYDISFNGYYLINVYVDKFYGCIISLEKEDFEYYDSISNQIDMRISVIETDFLYEVKDPLIFISDNVNIYLYMNKYYLKINNDEIIKKIIEHSDIVYENTEEIINRALLFDF